MLYELKYTPNLLVRSSIAFNLFESGPGGVDDEQFICESDELLVAFSCTLPFSLQVVVDVDDVFHIFTGSIFIFFKSR